MTVWDILILAVTLALVVEGTWKGAVRLGFGLAGLLVGYLYAGYAADAAARHLAFLVEHLRRPVAVIAGFLVIFTLFVLAGAVVSRLVKAAGLGCVNRVLGATLGLVTAIYLAGGLVHLSSRLSPDYPARLTAGPVVRLMSEWAVGMEALIPPGMVPHPSKKDAEPTVPVPSEPPPPGTPETKPKGDST